MICAMVSVKNLKTSGMVKSGKFSTELKAQAYFDFMISEKNLNEHSGDFEYNLWAFVDGKPYLRRTMYGSL